jgi:hypothetical protein
MKNGERKFIELLYPITKKYASWDPEVLVQVGDYGRITTGPSQIWPWSKKSGTYIKEGNIYEDGRAEKYGILPPTEQMSGGAEGRTCIASTGTKSVDAQAVVGACVPRMF